MTAATISRSAVPSGEGWGVENPLKSGNKRIQDSRLANPVVTGSGNNGPLRPSRTVDARGVASGRRVMDVQIDCSRVGEEPFDGSFQLTSVDQLPTDHHCIGIEGAHRKCADLQPLRHLVDRVIGLLALAHKDGKAHAIG